MNGWLTLAEFRPRRLTDLLEELRRLFPTAEEMEQEEHLEGFDPLRERLRSLDDAAVETAAVAFVVRDLRRMLMLLCLPEEDPVVRGKARRILELRASPAIVRDAIAKLLTHYPADVLEEMLVAVIQREPDLQIHDQPVLQAAANWLRAGSLCLEICRAALATGPASLEQWFEAQQLSGYPNVTAEVWKHLLTSAPGEFYSRHDPIQLLQRVRGIQSEVQIAFGQRYLTLLESRQAWNEQILRWILDRFGDPGTAEAMPRFWEAVSVEVRQEFRRWVIERQMADFFRDVYDPNGRFAFWKQFIDHIRDAKLSRDGSAALLDFGRFFVVEFAEIGNAAYVYPTDCMQRLLEKLTDPKAVQIWYRNLYLKDRTIALDRILHTPNWQWKYGRRVQNLINARQWEVRGR